MIWKAYELLAYLRHLTLSGTSDDGDLEWIGTTDQWSNVHRDIDLYEGNV